MTTAGLEPATFDLSRSAGTRGGTIHREHMAQKVTTAGLEPATVWWVCHVTLRSHDQTIAAGNRSQTRYHCAR